MARRARACRRRPAGGRLRAGRGRTEQALAGHYFAELAQKLTAEGFRSGCWAARPRRRSPPRSSPPPGPRARDLTSPDLRNAILALKLRRRLRVERFRPRSCRRRDRHADHRHLRADQPVALGAAQSARRGDRNTDRRALPALPQADLPARSPPLHARHPGRPGAARRAARAWAGHRPDSPRPLPKRACLTQRPHGPIRATKPSSLISAARSRRSSVHRPTANSSPRPSPSPNGSPRR